MYIPKVMDIISWVALRAANPLPTEPRGVRVKLVAVE